MKKKKSTVFKKINNDNTNIIITIIFIFVIIICCKIIINYLNKPLYHILQFRSSETFFNFYNPNIIKQNKENMNIMVDDKLISLDTNIGIKVNLPSQATEKPSNINLNKKNNYLNGIDVIYWINLDRAKDRQIHMKQIFKDPVFNNIQIKRIKAFDGKNEDMSKYYKVENTNNININKNTTNIEYACFLSHLDTIRQFSESNYDTALILEDDITLEYKKYWKEPIKDIISNAPNDWEILQLSFTQYNEDFFIQNTSKYILNSIMNIEKINKCNKLKINCVIQLKCVGMVAYIIKKETARKLIKNIYLNNVYYLNNKYLHYSDEYLNNIFKTYIYRYPYFTYNTNNSYIHNSHLQYHINSKNIITNFLQNNL